MWPLAEKILYFQRVPLELFSTTWAPGTRWEPRGAFPALRASVTLTAARQSTLPNRMSCRWVTPLRARDPARRRGGTGSRFRALTAEQRAEIFRAYDHPSTPGPPSGVALVFSLFVPGPIGAAGENGFVVYRNIPVTVRPQEKTINAATEMFFSGVDNVVVEHPHKNGMVAVGGNWNGCADPSEVLHAHFGEIEIEDIKFSLINRIGWQAIYPAPSERNAAYESWRFSIIRHCWLSVDHPRAVRSEVVPPGAKPSINISALNSGNVIGGNLGDLLKSISGPPQGNCEESKDGREKRDVGIRLVENIIPQTKEGTNDGSERASKNAIVFFGGLLISWLIYEFAKGRP